MADQVMISVTRDELYALFKNHKMVRAFENLMRTVTVETSGGNSTVLDIAQEARRNSEGLAVGALGPRAKVPPSVRPGEGLVSQPDAAGQVFGLDVGFAAMAARSFGNRPPIPPAQREPNDAQDILAARAFNRR